MKQKNPANETTYYSITYVCSLLLIVGLFPQLKNDLYQSIYDILYSILTFITITFCFFWLRKRIVLFGLALYTIVWNTDLLLNPIFQTGQQIVLNSNLKWAKLLLMGISVICVFLGLVNKFKHKYLTALIKVDTKIIIGVIFGTTVSIQLIFRNM